MLYLSVAWLALMAVSVPTGMAVLGWTQSDQAFDRLGDRLMLAGWLGLLVLGSVLILASFAFALSPGVGAAIGAVLVGLALLSPSVRRELSRLRERVSPSTAAGFLVLVAGVAILTAQPLVYSDTGAYHTGAIGWLSDYGAVHGVALVYYPFGFVSSWLALAAPFNPDSLRDNAVAVMGGFALLLITLQAVLSLARAFKRQARRTDWFFLSSSVLVLPVLAVSQQVNVSAEPDIGVTALGLMVGWSMLTIADRPNLESAIRRFSPGPAAIPLLLALGAMTVKQQAAPLVLVAALFFIWTSRARVKALLWSVGLGVVVLAPIAIYGFLATGCVGYPLPLCTDVAWSVGGDFARHVSDVVRHFQQYRLDASTGNGLDWVRPWLTDDLSKGLAAAAALGAVLLGGGLLAARQMAVGQRWTETARRGVTWVVIAGTALLLACLIRVEEISMLVIALVSLIPVARKHPASGWLLALGLTGIAVTLVAAPDPRFALGYMGVLVGRFAVFQGPAIWSRFEAILLPPRPAPAIGLTAILAVVGLAAAVGPVVRPTTSRSDVVKRFGLVLPPSMPSSPLTISATNSIDYRVPDGFCWDAELPCTPAEELDPNVVLRDPSAGLEAGFARK